MAIFDTGIRADHPHFRNIKVLILYLAIFVTSDNNIKYASNVQKSRNLTLK